MLFWVQHSNGTSADTVQPNRKWIIQDGGLGVAAGNIHRLQIVMNAAARLVTDTGRYEHITQVLRDILYWLPVQKRIIFKITVLAFNCIRESGPVYFNDVCPPLADISGRFSLRAADRGDLLVPSTKTKIGS